MIGVMEWWRDVVSEENSGDLSWMLSENLLWESRKDFWVEHSSKNTEEKEVRICIEIAATKDEEKSKI